MTHNLKTVFTSILLALFILSCSRDEPTIVQPPPPTVVTVKLNEIYSRGDSLNPDWIEIYNPSTSQINIGGYKIYDIGGQGGTKPKKEIPAGTTISSKGFFVIVTEDTSASGFGLSSSGEKVWLENSAGTLIDTVTFPALGVDTSYARKPDGSSLWSKISPPTKGAPNDTSISTDIPLVMNEIFSRGTTADPDWIEIYNPNPIQIDLTGYKIYDSGGFGGSKPKKEFPSGTTISAYGFYVIVTDHQGQTSDFGLSSSGERVWFENSAGAVIDEVTFPAMDVTQSYSRIPDGSANWQLTSNITRGGSNR